MKKEVEWMYLQSVIAQCQEKKKFSGVLRYKQMTKPNDC